MCTVTFFPDKSGFTLTFSRDEKQRRPTLLPKYYPHNDIKLLYPKDNQAGGTWFATTETGKTACLLNGAFENHTKQTKYARSRGLIVLESFYFESVHEFVRNTDLRDIEPFKLLLIEPDNNNSYDFFELIWDGHKKHFKPIDTQLPNIWSSSTLYDPITQKNRRNIFFNWMNHKSQLSPDDIFEFQSQRHGLADSEDFIMQGQGDLKTLSLTQLQFSSSQIKYKHLDLQDGVSVTFDLKEKEVANV